ncbi:MAG: ATP synthase F1 subunit epsilon [Actinobacteria bacterium]|nr:ATP synthase F1 subunit epsilon [Actinomycetota bacterium]
MLQVELVSPEEILFQGEAEMVVCRTTDGEIAFLTDHVPFLGSLGAGEVRIILPDHRVQAVQVDGGFVEVRDNRVIILSDAARLGEAVWGS